jgi:repressor LexA
MHTGEIIRALREKQGLSQETLATRLGYKDRSSIAKIESGKVDLNQSKLEQLSEVFHVSVAHLMGLEEMPAMNKIPILGAIACGAPILAQEHIEGYTSLPEDIHADFALICKGDSMIGARIFDGDTVYIRRQDTVEQGQIAAVLIDGEATLKRVRWHESSMSLLPENPMHRPIVLLGEEMNRARILGKAVAFTASIR